jgi:hypothetical protein
MKARHSRIIVIGIATVLAMAANPSRAADLHHAFGLTYSGGAQEVADFYDDLGYSTSGVPIGLSYRPYLSYDSGMRVDFDLGPIVAVIGDIWYLDVPISSTIGYDFETSGGTSFYLRGGGALHILDGDDVEDSMAVGAVAAAGVHFKKSSSISYILEVSYDTATTTLYDYWDEVGKDVHCQGINVTFGIVF